MPDPTLNENLNGDNLDLIATTRENVWYSRATNKYYYSDETYRLDGPYETLTEAAMELERYVKTYLR